MLSKRILISNQAFNGSLRKGRIYMKGDFYEKDGHCFYFEYYLYDNDKCMEEYFIDFLRDKVAFIKGLKGEFCLIDYDIEQDCLFFATDRLGKETLYVYQTGEQFILTNDFWMGIELIQPTEEEIDWQHIKEMIIHAMGILHSTAVKNYELMPAASYAQIHLQQSLIPEYVLYWNFEFHQDNSIRLEDAADRMYEIFDETFNIISKKFPPETRFGVGLSGGWDSRLIVAYAQKYNLNIVPYCVGEKYSMFPFHTNGYRVVKKMVKHFQLDNFTFIPYNSETYLQQAMDDVLYAPTKSSEISISCRSFVPEYDVMLNGEHGGVFLGEFDQIALLDYNAANIQDYLLKYSSWNQGKDMIFSQEEKACLDRKLKQYIKGLNTDDRFQIFYRFFFEIRAPRSKCGFFETDYGLKERYSPYLNPDFMDYYLTWPPLFLVYRTIQRKFFMTHFEHLSKMADETYDAPLYWKNMNIKNVPIRLLYAAKNHIFKSSMRRDKWLLRDKSFYKLLKTVVRNNQKILESYFSNLDVDKFYKMNPRASANLVKMLIEVDVLLNCRDGNRREFIEKRYN